MSSLSSLCISPVSLTITPGQQHYRNADGDVDQEDGAPARYSGQQSAQCRAEGQADVDGHGIDAQGLAPFLGRERIGR